MASGYIHEGLYIRHLGIVRVHCCTTHCSYTMESAGSPLADAGANKENAVSKHTHRIASHKGDDVSGIKATVKRQKEKATQGKTE